MPVTFTKENNTVAVITMDSGENRFNAVYVNEFLTALDEIESDESIKSVVLCSKDEKFWSLGVDVEWTGKVFAEGKKDELRKFLYDTNTLLKRILTYPMPVIAAVGGHAFGNGAILAMCCDFRFMKSGRGFICFPEVDINIAFLPSMLEIIRKTLPSLVMEDMILTGRKVGAAEFEQLRVVIKACDDEEILLKESIAFASTFNKPRGIFADHKKRMHKKIFEVMESEDSRYIEPLNLFA